jgi:hypothetical protein
MPDGPDRESAERQSALERLARSHRAIYVAVGIAVVAALVGVFVAPRVFKPTPAPTPTAAAPEEPTTARFTMLGGTVKVKPKVSLEWRDATPDTPLRRNDLVRTGRDSAAEITFLDGTVVHVRPDSVIMIEEASENPRTNERKVVWHVSSGEVNYGTGTGPDTSTEFTTDTMRVRHSGPAAGAVRVASNGESDVRVFRGVGEVETRAGQKAKVVANQGVKVSSSGQAGAVVSLPDAPQLMSPTKDANLLYVNPSVAATTLSWKETPGARAYRVLVDVNPGFNRPMFDRLNMGTTVRLQGLDVGQYCWKVAAVDRDNAEGRFSDFSRFSVARPPAPAPGAPPSLSIKAFEIRANILQIKGQTDPGAAVLVNGEALTVQADGTFNEFVTLEKVGQQEVRLRAVSATGGVREETRSVVVAF